MKRFLNALRWPSILLLLCALNSTRALGQAQIANPTVWATTVAGNEVGTLNTQFIFQADITPSDNMHGLVPFVQNTPPPLTFGPWPKSAFMVGNEPGGDVNGNPLGAVAYVVIDPYDPANPENGGRVVIPMVGKGSQFSPNHFVAYVPGFVIGQNPPAGDRVRFWSIVARDNNTGGTLKDGVNAAPKPALRNIVVVNNQDLEILPVDQNFQPDKRVNPGQLGNGLRVDPQDSTSINDGGSGHVYTWRVRVRNKLTQGYPSGLAPSFFLPRTQFEWRDPRFDNPFNPYDPTKWNSGVVLVLTDPLGTPHYCPMEIDPDGPNGGVNQGGTYVTTGGLLHPVGNPQFDFPNGVFYRFRMLPTQYQFNWGPLPGEGPFTAFGGPTFPDQLPALPIGANFGGGEVIGRPFANEYTGFAGPDRNPIAPAYPMYTNNAGRAGRWSYYYMATTDLRPRDRPVGATNGDIGTYPNDTPGADPGAYFANVDSDTGLNPGDPSQPYVHPTVTPMLSDGGWTDDLVANGYGQVDGNGNSHRERVTTKTRVRFMVRVTKGDNNPLPANGVQVYIDGQAHTMTQLPVPNNNDYIQGRIFYYDTTFPPGQEGQHYTYFLVDDGIHRAIWPRRDAGGPAPAGTNDGRFVDPQSQLIPSHTDPVNFGTNTIGKNFLNEPLVNHRPTLTNPTVTPPSGSDGQAFTYTITYTDLDNDEPVDTPPTAQNPSGFVGAAVVIDGVEHRMSPANNNPTNQGRVYTFTMTLNQNPTGAHTYFFRFRDNWNTLQAYGISAVRREDGEFVTYPVGDDNGNPSYIISGPTIVANQPSRLTDPGFFGSNQANTPATLYDFTVKYSDPNNNKPSTLKFYLSMDNGATYDGGTAMVPAENNNNYLTGVLFHLPNRIQLPFNANQTIRYRFSANNGIQQQDTTLVQEGSGNNALGDGSAHPLSPVGGSTSVFSDGAHPSYKDWVPVVNGPSGPQTIIFAWRKPQAGNPIQLTYGPGALGFTLSDPANGVITLNTPIAQGDTVFASYLFADAIGPKINQDVAPVLTEPKPGDPTTNNGTLTPLNGSPTTKFTYSVLYTSSLNEAPSYVNVVIDTNSTFPMVMDPSTPTPVDYRKPVRYTYQTTLPIGSHTYHFEASDGALTAWLPLDNTQNPPAKIQYPGPKVADNGNLKNPLIQPFPKGKSIDNYTFTITYQNATGIAPAFPIEVQLTPQTPPGGAISVGTAVTATMSPIDPIGPTQYQNGVRYQIQLSAATNPTLVPGNYAVTFDFQGQGAATSPLNLIVNARPVLGSPLVNPNPASQAGNIAFSITYSDANGDPPVRGAFSTIVLYVDGAIQNVVPTTVPANPTAASFQQGVTYTWTIPAKSFTVTTPASPHHFYFSATDDLEDANPPNVPAAPGNPFNIKAPGVPTLTAPPGGTLTPLVGAQSGQYTYSVIYTHPDNVAPVSINLFIDPGTANAQTIPLQPAAGQAQPLNYMNGVTYTYTTQPGSLAPGLHTYYFEAADQVNTVDLPLDKTKPLNGPTINFPPTLSNGTVFIVGTSPPPTVNAQNALTPPINGNVLTKLVFQVTYTDQNPKDGPQSVTVKINNAQTITLQPAAGQAQPYDYSKGVIYTTDPNGTTLGAGQKAFHFDTTDGLDNGRFPAAANTDITGLTIANVPVLSAPTAPDTTVSPAVGPLSTTFTYKIVYTHADNTPPAFVNLILDDGTSNAHTVAMAPVGANTSNYSAGVTYQAQYRFNSGAAHTYRFEAGDTVSVGYVARFPVTNSTTPPYPTLSGPSINVPRFLQPTFTPAKPIIGQPVTVSSQLQTNSPIGTPIAIQVIQPDGTGFNDSATTDPATGNFTYTFTPKQTGDFKISFTWGGSPGTYDPITVQFPFSVGGIVINLTAGEEDMIASPLIPVTPDPTITFSPTDGANPPNPVAITHVNLVKWVPNGASAYYSFLNTDGNFPGITGGQSYWVVKPDQNVVLNPKGKLWDQTQPYTIPLSAGWNMIASVYLQDINWSAVKVRSDGQLLNIADAGNLVRPVAWTFNRTSGGYEVVALPNGVLSMGRGYWVHALQAVDLVLSPPGTRAVIETRDVIQRSSSLQIAARTGNRVDRDNYAPLTKDGNGRLMLMEKPPYLANYVTVRFVTGKVDLPADSRAAAAGADNVVVFDVDTDQKRADVMVQFPNLSVLGRKTEVTLVDFSNNSRSALGTSSGITYNTGDNKAPRRFALIMSRVTMGNRLIITSLQQQASAPNRSLATTFTYNISGGATIRAQIVSGQRVIRDLETGRAATQGVNELVWDGRDGKGGAVPNGVYLLKLTATDDKGRNATAALPIVVAR